MGCGHRITTVRLPKTQETNRLFIIISGTATAVSVGRPLFMWGCHIVTHSTSAAALVHAPVRAASDPNT